MKAPRSDVVLRRFMRGEGIEAIALSIFLVHWKQAGSLDVCRQMVQAALRRAFEKQRRRR